MEQTFVLLKPDAIRRRLVKKIFAIFERNGLRIVKKKSLKLSPKLIWRLYSNLNPKQKFAKAHVRYVSSGRVIAAILQGRNAIRKAKRLVGATNPEKAAKGTIRRRFGYIDRKKDLWFNVVHAADSKKNAKREAELFGL
jgi:nucleoside-diphosphate kinase